MGVTGNGIKVRERNLSRRYISWALGWVQQGERRTQYVAFILHPSHAEARSSFLHNGSIATFDDSITLC